MYSVHITDRDRIIRKRVLSSIVCCGILKWIALIVSEIICWQIQNQICSVHCVHCAHAILSFFFQILISVYFACGFFFSLSFLFRHRSEWPTPLSWITQHQSTKSNRNSWHISRMLSIVLPLFYSRPSHRRWHFNVNICAAIKYLNEIFISFEMNAKWPGRGSITIFVFR